MVVGTIGTRRPVLNDAVSLHTHGAATPPRPERIHAGFDTDGFG